MCITDLRITDFFNISFLVYNWFYLLITDFVTAVNLVKSRRICSIYLKSRKSIGCGIGKRNVPIKRNNSSSALQAKNWVFACLDLCSAIGQYLILKIIQTNLNLFDSICSEKVWRIYNFLTFLQEKRTKWLKVLRKRKLGLKKPQNILYTSTKAWSNPNER